MAQVDELVYTPGPPPPTRFFGLRFVEPADETAYQEWRAGHVRPFMQFAMYSATAAGACAWVAVVLGALVELRGLALLLITLLIGVLVAGAVIARSPTWQHLLPTWAWLVNLTGGLLALGLTMPLHSITATAACVAMAAYFGLTMFRLTPLLALAAVGPYIAATMLLAVWWHGRGILDRNELVLGLFISGTTLVTGMVINLAVEWTSRRTYLDHLVITEQQQAVFEERTHMARFLSPEVTASIHDRGLMATVRTEMLSLTAVSIDLRGFTAYTRIHGATQMVKVLREYYDAIIEASRQYGATVSGFSGDGALVLVGAPIQRADHTRAGLELGRTMLARVREVTARHTTEAAPLGAGVGIASGECAVGAIGSLSQLEYTAIGHSVNIAVRLCDIARDGQILMAPGTARALEEDPRWTRELVQLSGIPESLEVTIEETLTGPARDSGSEDGAMAGS